MVKIVDNTAFIVLDKAVRFTEEGIRRGLLDVAPQLVRDVRRRIMDPPKTGRVYNIGGTLHQASAPGESPANLTGDLARSINTKVSSPTRLLLGAEAEHAGWMEYGTEDGRIAPRPYLRPTGVSMAREVEQAILRGVGAQFK